MERIEEAHFFPVISFGFILCLPRIATNIPFMSSQNRNCEAQFPHSCVCARFIYSRIGPQAIFLQQNRQIDRGNI